MDSLLNILWRHGDIKMNYPKHWTIELAEKVFDSGYKYAIMRRKPNFVDTKDKPKMIGFNNISELYDKFEEISFTKYERVRLALKPGPDKHSVMYYREDGSYWVVGYIFERPSNYKMPDLSQAGIVKI